MYRIDNPSSVSSRPVPGPPGSPGWFTNGNPAAAQEATIVDDWWCNQIQEEIMTVIEQAGIVPDKASNSQLFEALNKLYLFSEDLGAIYLTIQTYREWDRAQVFGKEVELVERLEQLAVARLVGDDAGLLDDRQNLFLNLVTPPVVNDGGFLCGCRVAVGELAGRSGRARNRTGRDAARIVDAIHGSRLTVLVVGFSKAATRGSRS